MSVYDSSALVEWKGTTLSPYGLGGNYSDGNIRTLYQATIDQATQLSLNGSGLSTTTTATTVGAIVSPAIQTSLQIAMSGNSPFIGAFNATVNAAISYQNIGGHWMITQEVWNFVKFYGTKVGGSTTFPEWVKEGPPNPNASSPDPLHNFAWNYGGIGAALLILAYVATIAIVFAARRLRTHERQGSNGDVPKGSTLKSPAELKGGNSAVEEFD